MRSCSRWIGIGLAVVLLGAPALAAPVPVPNAKYEQPTIVIQAQNGQKLLDNFRKYLKLNGGTEETLKKVDDSLQTLLGDKGFAGVDLTKPIGGYVYLRPKFEQSSMVLVVPFTDEKDALDLIGRLQLKAQESKAKGVYELVGGPFVREFKGHLRFHDKHAYIAIHGSERDDKDALDSLSDNDKLIPISRLVDEKDTAVLAATLTGKRMPKELTDLVFPLFDELNGEVDRMQARAPKDMPKNFPPFLKEMLGWGRRSYDLMIADGDTLTGRLLFDSKTGDLDIEATLVPKAKSGLTTDLATFTPAKGRFQQIVTKDAVGGGWVVLPGPIPKGVRSNFGNFWAEWLPMLSKETGLPAELGPLYESLGTILQKAITDGEVDLGAAMFGPNKAGHYTVVGAFGLDDPAPLVKLVLALAKDLPKDFAEALKLNAYKIGDVPVHTVALAKLLPEDVMKIFGEKPALNIAVGKKGLYLAVGPNAEGEIKRAMALKPVETRAFDTLVNMAKAKEMVLAAGGNDRNFNRMPLADRLMSMYALDLRGGSDFKVRLSTAQFIMGFFMAFAR